MPAARIGAQMYTVREHTRTPRDVAATCARIKAMGYDGVQASALGPIDPAELRRILEGEGLACAATHVALQRLQDEPQQVIDEHALWNCRYTAIGGYFPGKEAPWSRASWMDFAERFGAAAEALKGSDVVLGYHNHSHELAPLDGTTPLRLLLETLPARVWFELDTYWIAHGGGDPAAWIDAVAGRIPCVHVKDMTITPDRQQKMCEIGDGNLNWPRILDACRRAGVEWYLVERDDGDLDPFDSLERSLHNLRPLLAD